MNVDKLQKLADLRERGVITQKEFNAEKIKLLNQDDDTNIKIKESANRESFDEMTVNRSLQQFWSNYVGWGRANIAEYWYCQLFYFGIPWLFVYILLFICGATGCFMGGFIVFNLMRLLWFLLVLVPGFTLTVRRLHDTNRSAWNMFWILFPIVGWIVLFVFTCLPGNPQKNIFGVPRIKQKRK